MILYRPTGLAEMILLYQACMRAWPPRRVDQPIFYPVLNRGYARQIAADWNTREPTAIGYVTRFSIPDSFAERYPPQIVGARQHEELWVPAGELEDFNARMEAEIEVLEAHLGEDFVGHVPEEGPWAGLDAAAQLERMLAHPERAIEEAAQHGLSVFLHWPVWPQLSSSEALAPCMEAIARSWEGPPLPSHSESG